MARGGRTCWLYQWIEEEEHKAEGNTWDQFQTMWGAANMSSPWRHKICWIIGGQCVTLIPWTIAFVSREIWAQTSGFNGLTKKNIGNKNLKRWCSAFYLVQQHLTQLNREADTSWGCCGREAQTKDFAFFTFALSSRLVICIFTWQQSFWAIVSPQELPRCA